MRQLLVWTSDHFPVPLPEGHPFPAGKYARLREHLTADGVLGDAHIARSVPAPIAWLEDVHEHAYLARVLEGRLDLAEERRIGMPWSAELVARARAALYGTVMAAHAALEHGVAGNLAGGTHHAFRDHGEGYCLFNDVAVAIAQLRRAGEGGGAGAAARPFVLDLDVHQGNGTAAIFADDPSVFTFSIHGAGNYPLVKERGRFDLELADGATDDAYLAALDSHLERALDSHRPDLVFYQAGVDGLSTDRFGRLALTHEGLAARDARVFAACEARRLPVVVTLGGGYARPIEDSIRAHAGVFRAARDARQRRG